MYSLFCGCLDKNTEGKTINLIDENDFYEEQNDKGFFMNVSDSLSSPNQRQNKCLI